MKVEIPDVHDDHSLGSQVQKNFICEHCYSAFRSSYHLKRHILTHTGTALDLMLTSCYHSYMKLMCVYVCVCFRGKAIWL